MSTGEEKAMNIWVVFMIIIGGISALIAWALGIPIDVVMSKIFEVLQKASS